VSIALDHVIIFCAAGAPEASALVRLGLQEAAPNIHPGQGTANRRFCFENAYLELLYVSDFSEACSDAAPRPRLWERWTRRSAGACPFAMVLRTDRDDTDRTLPFATWTYRPRYLPAGLAIDVAIDTPLEEPEVFHIAMADKDRFSYRQRVAHAIPARRVTGVSIAGPAQRLSSAAAHALIERRLLAFTPLDHWLMTIRFDDCVHGAEADLRPELPLRLQW
jgi:hypothetical protein